MNTHLVYGNTKSAKGSYKWATHEGGIASKCIACGQCESVCPQHIVITEELKRAAEVFE
jgi:predicted aldo/keto reductase-like oxidoreductase